MMQLLNSRVCQEICVNGLSSMDLMRDFCLQDQEGLPQVASVLLPRPLFPPAGSPPLRLLDSCPG